MSCTQTFLRVAVRCNRTRKEERVKDTSTTRGNKKRGKPGRMRELKQIARWSERQREGRGGLIV